MTIGYTYINKEGKTVFIGKLGWAIFAAYKGIDIDELIEVDLGRIDK